MIITKCPGFVDRLSPERLFAGNVLWDIGKRDENILEAVERYEYQQREIADYLHMNSASKSRISHEKKMINSSYPYNILISRHKDLPVV